MPIVEPRHRRQGIPGARFRDDDEALIARVQAGDERAFATIFKRHHAPLLSYCRHMLGNRDEGEDALQQAFIKAHHALRSGTAPRELRPWLYAIARNCCLSAIAARRPTASLEDQALAVAGLSDEVRQREDLRELLAALGRLPEDQRSALLLAELDDLNHQAIAGVVGCPVSKVKALVYQARSALIADRDARETPCHDIREQLAVARGGELRRGPLRRHLKLCSGCRDFQLAVNAQRQSLAALLPVLPSAGLAAAVLGHGVAHTASAATIGGAGAGAGVGPAGGAAATSVGVTSTGATAAGGSGIAATGTTAASTAAAAGAGGGAGVGAVVGGGLITKLAVGGTVIALAAAGAAAVRRRPARAISAQGTAAISSQVARARLASFARRGSEMAGVAYANDDGPYGAPGSESPTALASPSDPAGSASVGPFAAPTGGGGSQPLLTLIGVSPPSPVSSGIPGASAPLAAQSSDGEGSPTVASKAGAKLRRRALRLRSVRRAHRRATLRRARRRARLRKAHRKALVRRVHRVAPKPPKQLAVPVAPPPVRIHRRKARPISPPLDSPTASATGSEGRASKGTKGERHRPGAGAGAAGAGATGTNSETSTTSTGSGKGKAASGAGRASAGSSVGSGSAGAGNGSGSAGPGNGTGSAGSGTGTGKAGSTTGTRKAGSGTGAEKSRAHAEGEETGSGAKNGKTASETGTSTASESKAGQQAEPGDPASRASETTGATGAGARSREGAAPQPKKQHLVEEAQLPNL